MQDLRAIWSLKGFLMDVNQDDLPDNINFFITGVSEEFAPVGLIDFTARAGLETSGISFPLFEKRQEGNWEFQVEKAGKTVTLELFPDKHLLKLTGPQVEPVNDFLRWFSSEWPHAMADGWQEQVHRIEFKDQQYQLIGATGQRSEWFAARPPKLPIDPVVYEPTFKSLSDLWTTAGFYNAGRMDLNSQCSVGFEFNSQPTPKLIEKVTELSARIGLHATGLRFPLTKNNRSEVTFVIKANELLEEARISWKILNPSKTVAILIEGKETALLNSIDYLATATPYEEGGTFGIWEKVGKKVIDEPIILETNWEDVGEKERLLQTASKWAEEVPTSEHLKLSAFISEPKEIRKELENLLHQLFSSSTNSLSVNVHSAFKPAYHWIEENVLPNLIPQQMDIKQISIKCQKEMNEMGAELPIRWIQELYPVDALLSKKLGIDRDHIVFDLVEDQIPTYILEVTSESNELLFHDEFTIPVAEVDYINSGKKVYPTTGQLEIFTDGQLFRNQLLKTDRERFWQFFVENVLKQLPNKLPMDEPGRGFQMPLFSRLTVEVEMSEEERKLGIEEERHSSLEALHEDIYFNVLDYFHYIGEERNQKGMTSPGGVHPFMHVKVGAAPKATIRLYGFKASEEEAIVSQSLTFHSSSTEPVSCQVLFNNKLEIRETTSWIDKQRLKVPGWSQEAQPGTFVWLGGTSYEGRDIPVIDVTYPSQAQFISIQKLSYFKPTVLIETGHHPNEVSSMPAVLNLINELTSSSDSLLKKVNLVVIPCANQDGAALHRRMAEDNPEWKHHAARYNAVGLEYTHHRFQRTIFGEADVVPRIIERWLPDVYIDDHGIPSHEWVQPFAGYNSPPRFPVSYWIPNALIYGIAKVLQGEEYEGHRALLEQVVDNIANKISTDEEINEKNKYWRENYFKYGSQWLPDIFPIEQSNGMNFYHWKTHSKKTSTEYIARYPEWCAIELISEAADETVYGEALDQCMKAHELFDLGAIEVIARSERTYQIDYENGLLQYKRQRPLKVSNKRGEKVR